MSEADDAAPRASVSIPPLWIVPEDMREIFDDDPEIEKELLELYLGQAAETIRTLAASILRRDAKSVSQLSHMLKGSTGQLGVPEMAEIAATMETNAIRGYWSGMPERIACLKDLFESLSLGIRDRLVVLETKIPLRK